MFKKIIELTREINFILKLALFSCRDWAQRGTSIDNGDTKKKNA